MDTTWVMGVYIGTSMGQYRGHYIYVNTTRVERVEDKVSLSPHNTNTPFIFSADRAALDA